MAFVQSTNCSREIRLQNFNLIWPGGGGGKFDPPYRFFVITQKAVELGSSIFLAFINNTFPSLKAKSWDFTPTA